MTCPTDIFYRSPPLQWPIDPTTAAAEAAADITAEGAEAEAEDAAADMDGAAEQQGETDRSGRDRRRRTSWI